jgi:hypothetical protein
VTVHQPQVHDGCWYCEAWYQRDVKQAGHVRGLADSFYFRTDCTKLMLERLVPSRNHDHEYKLITPLRTSGNYMDLVH